MNNLNKEYEYLQKAKYLAHPELSKTSIDEPSKEEALCLLKLSKLLIEYKKILIKDKLNDKNFNSAFAVIATICFSYATDKELFLEKLRSGIIHLETLSKESELIHNLAKNLEGELE